MAILAVVELHGDLMHGTRAGVVGGLCGRRVAVEQDLQAVEHALFVAIPQCHLDLVAADGDVDITTRRRFRVRGGYSGRRQGREQLAYALVDAGGDPVLTPAAWGLVVLESWQSQVVRSR